MIGDIKNNTPVSSYQPSKEIGDFTNEVKKEFSVGYDILTRPWVELNDLSVIERDNKDKRTFNAFVDDNIEDPSDAWKWRGTRSKARNKAIALHAQLTAGYIIPMFLAQNEDDEEDRDFSDLMRDGIEWMIDNSNYKSSFLKASMGMLVNSVTFMGTEYADIYQTIKEKTDNGYTKKEVLDEVLSGFQAPIYTSSQVLITNAYEQNIQRQRSIIKRRFIDYSEVKAKYGEHENWVYVSAGIKSIYSEKEGLFYDVYDDERPSLVEEVTFLNRREDTEVCFLNGIYFGSEDVNSNPIRHRDNRNAPKYNVVPFGYQRISEHFFYYKSLMNAQYWDNQLLDAQYELGMNRAFLDTNMPVAISGTDKVDSDVIFPSAVMVFKDKDTKITPVLPQANLSGMFSAMSVVERSMDESSVSDTTAGQLPDPNQKATGIAIAQRNAQTLLQGVGKNLAESMVQIGDLMKDIFINHFTIPQVLELSSGKTKLKYRTLILNNKSVKGKDMTKVIKFDESLLGAEMTDKEKESREFELLEKTGYPKDKKAIYLINPEQFARFKFLTRIEPERMFPKNEEFMQGMLMQLYSTLRADPLINGDELVRRVLYSFFRGESDELLAEKGENAVGANPNDTQAGQTAMNTAVSRGMNGVGMV